MPSFTTTIDQRAVTRAGVESKDSLGWLVVGQQVIKVQIVDASPSGIGFFAADTAFAFAGDRVSVLWDAVPGGKVEGVIRYIRHVSEGKCRLGLETLAADAPDQRK